MTLTEAVKHLRMGCEFASHNPGCETCWYQQAARAIEASQEAFLALATSNQILEDKLKRAIELANSVDERIALLERKIRGLVH